MQTEVIKETSDEDTEYGDVLGTMLSMPSNGEEGEGRVNFSQALTHDFCEKVASTSSGFLVAYAAEVILFTRMTSIRKVAKYFSERFGKKISEMPIRDILHKVKTNKIAVTEEQIYRLGDAHPMARKFLNSVPWASDTRVSVESVIQEAPKRRGRPKKVQELAVESVAVQEESVKTPEPTNAFAMARENNLSTDPESNSRQFGVQKVNFDKLRPEHRGPMASLLEIQRKRREGFITPKNTSDE